MQDRKLSVNQITQGVVHVVVAGVFVRLTLLRVALQLKALNRPLAVCRYLQPDFRPLPFSSRACRELTRSETRGFERDDYLVNPYSRMLMSVALAFVDLAAPADIDATVGVSAKVS